MSWREVDGSGLCPVEAKGKRVKVRLRNGMVEGEKPVANGCPAGWHADDNAPGKGPAVNWRSTGSPFDVVAWDFVAG